MEQNTIMENKQLFEMMQKNANFSVAPYENTVDFYDGTKFRKPDITSAQKMQISALMQNMPELLSAETMSNAYVVKFPEGMPHTLTALKQGGFGSMIKGEDGKIVGHASFYEISAQASILEAFTVMSAVTGQYFMSQINHELKMINSKIDQILEFLYGEKKAELASEAAFVKYAYQNFASIMGHEAQRIATINSLQEAKRVAMKDVEFYLEDLHTNAAMDAITYKQLEKAEEKAYRIKNCIDISMQVYVMSGLLEMQYAQNMDESYVAYLKKEMGAVLNKYRNNILLEFGGLEKRVVDYKPKPIEKIDKASCLKKIGSIIEPMREGEDVALQKKLNEYFDSMKRETTYYVSKDGDVYIKAAC